MALKLMYITNRTNIAQIAEDAGVDRIFVDMEIIGKSDRQGGMDTVQSKHTITDVKNIRTSISKAKLLVRCNPIHKNVKDFPDSDAEIDQIINNGADIIMLPYFKTKDEVEYFVKCVNGRVKTILLFETPEAVDLVDEILSIKGIDEVFIGLNDLSLGYKKKFMFELLVDGTVEELCYKFRKFGYPYGFGGIASIGKGMLPSEKIIKEHYRIGSTCAILSRSFCNVDKITDIDDVKFIFKKGISEIRNLEKECDIHRNFFWNNKLDVVKSVNEICSIN